MKEAIKIKLLLIGLAMILITACTQAQNQKLPESYTKRTNSSQFMWRILSLNVNYEIINDYSCTVVINDKSKNKITSFKVKSVFSLYFKRDCEYEISFIYPGISSKTFILSTECPEDQEGLESNIHLHSGFKKSCNTGIQFDYGKNDYIMFDL